ncbi:MAG: hypothetical protein ABR975_06580 [Vulcanimicrobiaceae bacterium]|jgi:hypothetical protein
MKRITLALLAAPVLAAATVLAACSGGGTGATHSAVPAPGATSTPLQTTSSGAHLTLTIRRSNSPRTHASASGRRASAAAKRTPKYISSDAQGVQVVVSTSGATPTTQTVYADISNGSTLCTTSTGPNSYTATCTIPIPTLAASEAITATEVDTTPTAEVAATSLGTGFPNSSNILAVGTTTFTAAAGTTTNVSLGLSPVAAQWYDCGVQGTNGSAVEESRTGTTARIIVSAGTPATFVMQPEFEDIDGAYSDFDSTPLPFVDVNGSPTPITVNASSTHVGVDPLYNTGFVSGPTPAPTAYTQSTTIPNDGYEWYDCVFLIAGQYDGQTTSPTTIVIDQDLSASPQFTGGLTGASTYETYTHGGPISYIVVPLSVSVTTLSVAVGGSSTVTGSDFDAPDGMGAGTCSGTGSANITAGSYAAGSGTEQFTVTGTVQGTCTFTLDDATLGSDGPQTSAVLVTINPPPP